MPSLASLATPCIHIHNSGCDVACDTGYIQRMRMTLHSVIATSDPATQNKRLSQWGKFSMKNPRNTSSQPIRSVLSAALTATTRIIPAILTAETQEESASWLQGSQESLRKTTGWFSASTKTSALANRSATS